MTARPVAATVPLMRRPPLTDALLALGLVVLAQVTVWTGDVSGPRALVALIALAMTAPLAWRRAHPLAVFGVVLASVVALGAVDSSLDDLYTLLAPLVAIEAVGAHVALRPAAAALALTLVVLWIGLATETRHHETGDYGFVLFLYGGAWALGRALRSRGERAEVDARAAVSAERARIARELHDVVAHSVSVMVVQTSVVRRRIAAERAGDAVPGER
jgi:signal transduction histidine kinase